MSNGIRQKYPEGSVVAVTHGDLFALARAGYLGLPIQVNSIRLPHPYPGKGGLLRLKFDCADETYPVSEEYYDPNGEDPRWSSGSVALRPDYALDTANNAVDDEFLA